MRELLLGATALICPLAAHATTCTAPPKAAADAGYTIQTFGQDGIILGKNIFIDHGQTGISQQGGNILVTGQGNDNAFNDQISSATSDQQGSFFGGGAYIEFTMSFTGRPSDKGGWPSAWGNTLFSGEPNVEIDIVEWWGQQSLAFGNGAWVWGSGGPITSTSGNQPTTPGSGFDPSKPHKYALLWTDKMLSFYLDDAQGPNKNALNAPYDVLNLQQYHLLAGTGPNNPLTISSINIWQKDQGNNSFKAVPVPSACSSNAVTTSTTTTPPLPSTTPTFTTTNTPSNTPWSAPPDPTTQAAQQAAVADLRKQIADLEKQFAVLEAAAPTAYSAARTAGQERMHRHPKSAQPDTTHAEGTTPGNDTTDQYATQAGTSGSGGFQDLPTTTDLATLQKVMQANADFATSESGGTTPITLQPGDLTPGTGGSLTDAKGNVYTLPFKGGAWGNSMGQPVENGSPISDGTGYVSAIRINKDGTACFQNAKGLGWGCQGSGTWVSNP